MGLLLVSIFGSALFGTYLVANTVSGVTFTFLPSWLSKEVTAFILVAGFIAGFLLMRQVKPIYPRVDEVKDALKKLDIPAPPRGQVNPDYDRISKAWETPPADQSSLESLLSSAMINGLSADLNITLKLPTGQKLKLLGQDWEVPNAEITIAKKKPEAVAEAKPLSEEEEMLKRLDQLDGEKVTPQ